jgi:hypothetical protein
MDSDDQYENTRQFSTLSMGQTTTAPLNNTTDFLVLKIIAQIIVIVLYLYSIGSGK